MKQSEILLLLAVVIDGCFGNTEERRNRNGMERTINTVCLKRLICLGRVGSKATVYWGNETNGMYQKEKQEKLYGWRKRMEE